MGAFLLLSLLAGCQTGRIDPAELTRARFFLEKADGDAYSAIVTLPLSQVKIPVEGDAILSEFDYLAIDLAELELGNCLSFTLKPAAARAFYRISVANQGKRLVLVVDGQPIGARRIDGPVSDGRIYIFLEVPDETLEELAADLKKTNADIQKTLSR
ncbi:hypothetical protein [Pelagicoccus sp. SDUM812003]|uniref:hypothetical protein n=1 Tax=Pelagicoccus sp. SDUM812003 TaxID=3041267 RepID=UPI00280D3C3E|nr:hypothetical protein [Pelagicoccus sp. SDUM812003]MDQ8205436.1 hypothetical protein [Pelagicoccus sp. SDUM812003]